MEDIKIVLIGEVGTGKDYICNYMTKHYGFKKEITYTTRPMRNGEVNGKDYNFTTDYNFIRLLADEKILEYQDYQTIYGSWKYFTLKNSHPDISKSVIILDLDGYMKYKEVYPRCIGVFLSCVDDTKRYFQALHRLGDKLTQRDNEELMRRIQKDKKKFENIFDVVDYVIPQMYDGYTIDLIDDLLISLLNGGN